MASDRDDGLAESQPQLRGFRRRWQPSLGDAPDESGPLNDEPFGTLLDDQLDEPPVDDPEIDFDSLPGLDDWDVIPDTLPTVMSFGSLKRPFGTCIDVGQTPVAPKVLGAQNVESLW